MRLAVVAACAACGDASSAVDAAMPGACSTTTPWATAPDVLLGATQETAVVATGGKIYVLGGFVGLTITPAVQVFDPAACAWSMGPDLPQPMHHANAAVIDGTIYIAGALTGGNFAAIPNVWSWNPASETGWAEHMGMPAGTQRGAAVTGAIDGKLYVAGGFRNGAVADVSVYDPIANGWTALPALPAARDHGCGGAIAGKLYYAGGRDGGAPLSNVYEYTPGGAWAERAPMITGRGGTACGVAGDRLVVVGGEGNAADPSGVFPQSETYDASANTWEPLAMMPTPRHGMVAAVVDGKLYVPGGANKMGFGAVATHEVLTP
jgi:N-acetylneuraminic acid mutarotase